MASNPILIYCRPSREIICGTINDREQMDGVAQNASKLLDLYDRMFLDLAARGIRFYVYNFEEDPGANQLINNLAGEFSKAYQEFKGRDKF